MKTPFLLLLLLLLCLVSPAPARNITFAWDTSGPEITSYVLEIQDPVTGSWSRLAETATVPGQPAPLSMVVENFPDAQRNIRAISVNGANPLARVTSAPSVPLTIPETPSTVPMLRITMTPEP